MSLVMTSVTKRFGELTAVADLSLHVPRGTCFGLLGPNGAGKSTTMRLVTGQSGHDAGRVQVLGAVMPRDSRYVRARIGVVPQADDLLDDLTVRENLEVFARLHGVSGRRQAVAESLALVALADRAEDRVRHLSGGMRRRLMLARALIHRPDLILLDEPTVGLDPRVRHELWELIDTLREQGKTILMSTHYIEEAERLADLVAIMVKGRVIATGTPRELIRRHAGEELLELYTPADRQPEVDLLARAYDLTLSRKGPIVMVHHADRVASEARHRLSRLGHLASRRPSLEDVYVLLTERSANEEVR